MPRARARAEPRLVALDWSVAEVALSLGIVPLAASEAPGYRAWVGTPTLPPGVLDLGLRPQPNLELIQRLAPDLILTIPERADLAARLDRIAPSLSLPIYTAAATPYALAADALMRLGDRIGRAAQARALIEAAQARLDALRRGLGTAPRPPLVVIRFVDARTIAVFGAGGLFQDVLDRLGLTNGWTGAPTRWGFVQVPLTELARLDPRVRLFYLAQPMPPDVAAMMARDPLWRGLPFVRAGAAKALPTVWFFGGLDAALRFANLVAAELAGPAEHAPG